MRLRSTEGREAIAQGPGTDRTASEFPAKGARNSWQSCQSPGVLRLEEHLAADGVPIGAGVGGSDVGHGHAAIGQAGDGRALHGEGQLQALDKALQINPDYDDAMAYENLLVRERADLADTKEEYDRQLKIADDWIQKALVTKKRKADAKNKTGGSIVVDPNAK